MKPKEWLFKNGHMTREEADKRGRMSLANKALIEAAVANGEFIDGYAIVKPSAKAPVTKSAPVMVEKVKVNDHNVVADIPDIVRDPREWDAYDDTGKKFAIGIKGCCENCRNSVTYCHCPFPVLRIDNDRVSVVTFKPRANKGA